MGGAAAGARNLSARYLIESTPHPPQRFKSYLNAA
jgi:hypothetical protein